MTREEAIGHIKDVICENNTIKPSIVVFEQEKEALYMAIKALEQEPILDKIRADMIEEMLSHSGTGEEVIQAYVEGLKKGVDILDEYKRECEEI